MIFTYKEVKGLVPIWEVPLGRRMSVEPFTVYNTNRDPWTINSIQLCKEFNGIVLYCDISMGCSYPLRISIQKTGPGGSYIRPQLPKYVRILS